MNQTLTLIKQLLEEEKNNKRGALSILQQYKKALHLYEAECNDAEYIYLQKFKVRAANQKTLLLRSQESVLILEDVKAALEKRSLHQTEKHLYNAVLMDIMDCRLTLLQPEKADKIGLELIDPERITDHKRFKTLRYESNRALVGKNVRFISLLGWLALLFTAFFDVISSDFASGFSYSLALFLLLITKLYELTNYDYYTLDPFEFFVFQNKLKTPLRHFFTNLFGSTIFVSTTTDSSENRNHFLDSFSTPEPYTKERFKYTSLYHIFLGLGLMLPYWLFVLNEGHKFHPYYSFPFLLGSFLIYFALRLLRASRRIALFFILFNLTQIISFSIGGLDYFFHIGPDLSFDIYFDQISFFIDVSAIRLEWNLTGDGQSGNFIRINILSLVVLLYLLDQYRFIPSRSDKGKK